MGGTHERVQGDAAAGGHVAGRFESIGTTRRFGAAASPSTEKSTDVRESGFFRRRREPSYGVYEAATGRWWLEAGLASPIEEGFSPESIPGAFELDAGVWVVPFPRRRELELPLTLRQQQIASLAAEGQTHREIAGRLGISAHTARTHLKNIYARLGVRTRMELIQVLAGEPETERHVG